MEPPPRLYNYEGLFTSVRSIDLPLKILAILSVFILLILIAAWIVSSKTYNRAPKDKKFQSVRLENMNKFEILDVLLRDDDEWKHGLFTGKINDRVTLVVNDWKVISLHEDNDNLDYYFSLVPDKFRRKWYGLWLSDYTLLHRSNLRAIVFHTFDTLSPDAFHLIGSFAAREIKSSRYQFGENVTGSPGFDIWIWDLVMEFVFFNSPDFCTIGSSSGKQSLVECLRNRMSRLLRLHESGKLPSGSTLVAEFDGLLSPLVRHVIDISSRHHKQSVNNKHIPQSGWRATSLLHQFVQAHHQLDEEGEFVGFLSPVHIAHLLVEISLILRCCLLRAIRLLLVVLAMRGDWQCRVREESKQVLTAEFRCSEQATSIPGSFVFSFWSRRLKLHEVCFETEKDYRAYPLNPLFYPGYQPPHCLNLRHTDNLPWTKALVNEIVRFSAAGFPMFALREAPRDGHLSDYDYAEGELILLNQLVYLNDRDVWERDIFTQADDEEKRTSEANAVPNRGQIQDNELIFPGLPFSPYRFLQKCDPESADKQLRLKLPGHWVRHMLAGYTVCVPNYSIYRLLTAIVVHIFGTGLHVTVEKNFLPAYSEAGDDSSLRIPRDLPPVCFTSSQ